MLEGVGEVLEGVGGVLEGGRGKDLGTPTKPLRGPVWCGVV